MESLVIGVSVVAYPKEPQPPPTLEVKMEDLLVGEEAGWESKQLYVKSTGVQNAFIKTSIHVISRPVFRRFYARSSMHEW